MTQELFAWVKEEKGNNIRSHMTVVAVDGEKILNATVTNR